MPNRVKDLDEVIALLSLAQPRTRAAAAGLRDLYQRGRLTDVSEQVLRSCAHLLNNPDATTDLDTLNAVHATHAEWSTLPDIVRRLFASCLYSSKTRMDLVFNPDEIPAVVALLRSRPPQRQDALHSLRLINAATLRVDEPYYRACAALLRDPSATAPAVRAAIETGQQLWSTLDHNQRTLFWLCVRLSKERRTAAFTAPDTPPQATPTSTSDAAATTGADTDRRAEPDTTDAERRTEPDTSNADRPSESGTNNPDQSDPAAAATPHGDDRSPNLDTCANCPAPTSGTTFCSLECFVRYDHAREQNSGDVHRCATCDTEMPERPAEPFCTGLCELSADEVLYPAPDPVITGDPAQRWRARQAAAEQTAHQRATASVTTLPTFPVPDTTARTADEDTDDDCRCEWCGEHTDAGRFCGKAHERASADEDRRYRADTQPEVWDDDQTAADQNADDGHDEHAADDDVPAWLRRVSGFGSTIGRVLTKDYRPSWLPPVNQDDAPGERVTDVSDVPDEPDPDGNPFQLTVSEFLPRAARRPHRDDVESDENDEQRERHNDHDDRAVGAVEQESDCATSGIPVDDETYERLAIAGQKLHPSVLCRACNLVRTPAECRAETYGMCEQCRDLKAPPLLPTPATFAGRPLVTAVAEPARELAAVA